MEGARRKYVRVALTTEEAQEAKQVGLKRHGEAVRMGLLDKHGLKPRQAKASHILGAKGERAYCKAFGLRWTASVNTFKAPDVGALTQVRTRSKNWYELLIRTDDFKPRDGRDPMNDVFVLVTTEDEINFVVVGWKRARDTRRDEWWKDHGGREPAWFVPHEELNSFKPAEKRETA